MKCLFAVLLLWGATRPQFLSRFRAEVLLPRRTHHVPAPPTPSLSDSDRPSPRLLVESALVRTALENAVKINGWTVTVVDDNNFTVNTKAEDLEFPVFRALLTTTESSGALPPRTYLTLQNRPASPDDQAYQRYRHSHIYYKRRLSDKSDGSLEAYVRHCAENFKQLLDRLNLVQTATGVMSLVRSVVASLKAEGLSLVTYRDSLKNSNFIITKRDGKTMYKGFVYPVSAEYVALSLSAPDEYVYIYNGQGTEQSFYSRLQALLRSKLSAPPAAYSLRDAQALAMRRIQERCKSYPATPLFIDPNDVCFAYQMPSTPTGNVAKDPSCYYDDSRILFLEYNAAKVHFIHFFADLKEMQVEDLLAPHATLYDSLLGASLIKNDRFVSLIRDSRLRSKSEVVFDPEKLRPALQEVFGVAPVDQAFEPGTKSDEGELKSSWGFPGSFVVNLYLNPEDYVLQVSRPDPKSQAMSAIQVAIPFVNSYDQISLIKAQVNEFRSP